MGFAGEITVSICFSVTAAICCYRFYLRLVVVRNYIWAEISLIFALCMQIGMLGSQLMAFKLDRQKDNVQAVRHSAQIFVVGAYFYFNALWSVKISVNLLHVRVTRKFPRLNAWAVRSVYIVLFCWIVVLVSFHFGCVPFSRRWDGLVGKAEPCPNVVREWDFWTHVILHIASDIALSILPYPALFSIQEWRLRAAVYGVYGIAFISVIVSIVRAVLLGINPRSNASTIRILSMIEVSTSNIVGALPCISSAFTRKFLNRRSSDNIYSSSQVNDSTGYNDRANFQLKGGADSERNTSFALSESTSGLVIGQAAPSRSGESTEDIIGLDEIRKVTTITMSIS